MIKFYNQTNKRYYYISINRDMLGDWVLCVNRGGIRVNVVRHYGYTDLSLLADKLKNMIKKRLRNGYVMI